MESWILKPQVADPEQDIAIPFVNNYLYPCFSAPTSFYSDQRPAASPFCVATAILDQGIKLRAPPMMPRRTRCREEPILLSPLQTSRHPKLTPGATLGDPREDSALSHYWFRLMVLMHTQTHSTGCTRTSPSPWPIHHVQCTQTVRQETDGFQVRHLQIEITSR